MKWPRVYGSNSLNTDSNEQQIDNLCFLIAAEGNIARIRVIQALVIFKLSLNMIKISLKNRKQMG